MKRKLCILTLVGLVAWSFAAVAQDNPPAGELQNASTSVTQTNDAAQPPAEAKDAPAPVAGTNAPAAAPDTNVTLVAANAAAADPAAQAPAAADTTVASTLNIQTNANAEPGGVIPLIVMDDVPLTDAIKNLARQAGLNYVLDPKVSFGQAGPDGRPVPQPSVSIRWENVTAAQALNALLSTYNLQLVEDPKSKIARVTVKDPAAPDPLVTKVIQLKWASPTNMIVALQNSLGDKRSKVIADVRTSQLVVVATEKELVDMEQLIEKLDTQTKQVLIEAKLLETSMSPSTSKGVDWSGTLAAQHVTFGNNALPGTPPTPASTVITPNGPVTTPASPGTIGGILQDPKLLMNLAAGSVFNPSYAFLNADGVSAVLSFLNKYADAKVISTPRTVTLDNEPARIEVTRASPIITVTPGTVQTAGGSSIQYTNLGVILNVTPRISANNYINLKVTPEVSRIFDTVKKQVSVGSGSGTYEADEYDIRRMDTRVMIPSGNTLVLGGLVQDDIRSGNTKVPLLGDIPGLGLLFRSDTKSRQKSNLLVFLTPTIVQDEDFQPTQTDFLKNPVPQHDTLEGDWSSWDSGKPRDWSQQQETVDSTKFSKVDGVSAQ
jgi:type II secretory pathway component GspD/PulD (secretin)